MNAVRSIVFVMFLFTCVIFHEISHSLVAQKFKIKVKHITLFPIGGIAFMERMPDKPKQEFLMSLAGPLFNIVLAVLLFYPLYLIMGRDIKALSMANISFNSWRSTILWMYWINPMLALFNLLPAFPMDGGRALRAFLAAHMPFIKATRIAVSIGHFFAIIFGLTAMIVQYPILMLIAFFIYIAASQEERQVKLKYALKEFKVKDVAAGEYHSIRPDTPLSGVLELSLKTTQQDFPVVEGDRVLGILTRYNLISALHEHKGENKAKEAMTKEVVRVSLGETLNSVYSKMAAANSKTALILQKGELKGIISVEDIARVYQLQSSR
ncbi:MAG: site-2 protease family protein [Candidatus Omnitrophica bacterium]|nr:site-2 protease family protein [Candidatus Omnitrophota bacterium]